MLIDTHCHLDDPRFSSRIESVLASAFEAGVERFILPGVTAETWDTIASLSRRWPCIFPAFGLHPFHAASWTPQLRQRLKDMKGIAVGEIGLDYTMNDPSRILQQEAFREQVRLAVERRLPLLIHCRKAFPDLLRIIREENGAAVGGIMHAFSGSVEIARECTSLGFLIAIAGTATYENAVKPLKVVRAIPLRYLVLETDSPDMTPEPYRGRGGVNEPAYLAATAEKVAAVKNVPAKEVGRITTDNVRRLFPMLS